MGVAYWYLGQFWLDIEMGLLCRSGNSDLGNLRRKTAHSVGLQQVIVYNCDKDSVWSAAEDGETPAGSVYVYSSASQKTHKGSHKDHHSYYFSCAQIGSDVCCAGMSRPDGSIAPVIKQPCVTV